jgi:SulP family sulfate permease
MAKSMNSSPLITSSSTDSTALGGPVDLPVLPRGWKHWFYRVVPAIDSLRTYSWRSLRFDLMAGLTVAAVALPQALAYATVAGLPPVYGLYTAIVMTIVGALFDSSRQLINGPTNAISIAVLSALAFVPEGQRVQAAIMLALLVGVIQTGITLLRLGDLTRYISHSVIVGFTLGAAFLLALDQLKNLLGLPNFGKPGDHFLVHFGRTMSQFERLHWPTLAIGLGTILLVLVLQILGRRLRVLLPDLLLTVIAMAFVVWATDLDKRGVAVVGAIPPHLPSFEIPKLDGELIQELGGSAFAIALLGLLEAVAMAKAIASRTGQKLDINQQCLSEGVANLAGSMFQCFPGSGSLTRSAINVQAGAVSQWSGVFAAIAVAATTLALAPFAYYIPRSALAGILFLSAWRLVDRRQLRYHLVTSRFDAGIVIATAAAAVFVSVEFCIVIGVFLSFVLFLPKVARLQLTEMTITPERIIRERVPADPPCRKLLIYSLEGELFFGASTELEKHLDGILRRARQGSSIIVLRLKRVRNPDAVCITQFSQFLDACHAAGFVVLFCGVRPDMARILHTSRLEVHPGLGRVFHEQDVILSSTLEAVRHAYDRLGADLCESCPRRGASSGEPLYYMI